ncbi:MAG: FAD-dependent thymidylate synthase [Bacteroidota bacterium]|nr:FAD-dependent thymidylate synthase [Bacteroidota bacterium]
MAKFISPEPVVKLVKAFSSPFRNAVATAKTCYSGKGIITDEQINETVEPLSRDMEIAKSIYEAGHHTTFQHAHFQFRLENVSRQFVWSFLHSHPFYNSEQVSQRYVEVKAGNYAIPPLVGAALGIYHLTVQMQIESYKKLITLLTPIVTGEYYKIFPARKQFPSKYAKDIKHKAQEIARYVLPVATFTYLYHTISGITLLRYHRLADQFDVPIEQKLVVQKMVDELLQFDPLYKLILEESLPIEETLEYQFFSKRQDVKSSKGFIKEFDTKLEDKISKLIDYKVNNEKTLADSVREVLGLPVNEINDSEAIDLVLNPKKNRLFGESLVLSTHSKLMRTLFHPSYTFRKKLSHTADSQDQRHRMTPASRPILNLHLTDSPDYIMPELIRCDVHIQHLYDEVMEKTWEGINKLKSLNVPDEFILYLLPNAFPIRFTESSDLLNLHHKYVMRLCYNSQEEIWRVSLEEAKQIIEINPNIGKHLLPPCAIRSMANSTPICPEGERFCGVKVWNLDIAEYNRNI